MWRSRARVLACRPRCRLLSRLGQFAAFLHDILQYFARKCGLRLVCFAHDVNVFCCGRKSGRCRLDRNIEKAAGKEMRSRTQGFRSLHAVGQGPRRSREGAVHLRSDPGRSHTSKLTVHQHIDFLAPSDEHVSAGQRHEFPRCTCRRRIGYFEHPAVNRGRGSLGAFARHGQGCRDGEYCEAAPDTHRGYGRICPDPRTTYL
jgi:hypothetical protein